MESVGEQNLMPSFVSGQSWEVIDAELPASSHWQAIWAYAHTERIPRAFFSIPNESKYYLALGAAAGWQLGRSETWSDFYQRIITDCAELPESVQIFGGADFEFRNARELDGCWKNFHRASFFIPEVLFEYNGNKTKATRYSSSSTVSFLGDDCFLAKMPAATTSQTELLDQIITEGQLHFDERAAQLIEQIQAKACGKVVLAEQKTLRLSQSPTADEVAHLIAELLCSQPEASIYAFGMGADTFFGATPEQLVKKRGMEVFTQAVAGSAPVVQKSIESLDYLSASHKNRIEHDFVVNALLESLAPRCSTLDFLTDPEERTCGPLRHLVTPIKGTLSRNSHVLDLLSQLHPTPAVAGSPTEQALQLLRQFEDFQRGWYAGPIGHFDAKGDGEFIVALRCGLLRGAMLHLYAGAGLVADSKPAAEAEEVALKFRALGDVVERAWKA